MIVNGEPNTFIIVTKSRWTDAPRIRHQITSMLSKRGYPVCFVEKNGLIGTSIRMKRESGVIVVRHSEIVHHQVRLSELLRRWNAWWEMRQFQKVRRLLCLKRPIVINCNYDSDYLRTVFSDSAIITLLHDDYIAGARKWMKVAAAEKLRATLRISDAVLAVSYPLMQQAERLGRSAELFLPWARSTYQKPDHATERTGMLLWGYFYNNLDYKVLNFLAAKGVRLHLAGPVIDKKAFTKLARRGNVQYHGIKSLGELKDVVASCCCSILPYQPDAYDGTVAAVTFSNRAFELMAHGLPLLYADLPALLEAPNEIVHRCRNAEDYWNAYIKCQKIFYDVQGMLECFLQPHTEAARYQQLINVTKKCLTARKQVT